MIYLHELLLIIIIRYIRSITGITYLAAYRCQLPPVTISRVHARTGGFHVMVFGTKLLCVHAGHRDIQPP